LGQIEANHEWLPWGDNEIKCSQWYIAQKEYKITMIEVSNTIMDPRTYYRILSLSFFFFHLCNVRINCTYNIACLQWWSNFNIHVLHMLQWCALSGLGSWPSFFSKKKKKKKSLIISPLLSLPQRNSYTFYKY
jgi:hypothetical protein